MNEPKTLEELLEFMSRYGRPRLGRYGESITRKNWCCSVEMDIALPGSHFKIETGFDHSTALSAAQECYRLMRNALDEVSKHIRLMEDAG